jgi:hypothetical protein
MEGSSSITLFEKSSPHHSLYIIVLLFPLCMKDWNKRSIVEARGEGPGRMSPVCYHHNNFRMESKLQNFSEELYCYGSMIVWRIRLYLAAYGQV